MRGSFVAFIVSFLIALVATQPAAAAKLINLGSEFEAFLSASKGQPVEQIEKNWEAFESKHQKIYDESVYRKGKPGWEQRAKAKRDKFFTDLPSISGKMIELFKQANRIVAEKEKQFEIFFPDLSPDIPVVFMPSLGSFNGQVRDLSDYGRTGLLMGVDFIVERNDNLSVLFAHEFFHAYHEDKMTGTSGATMATPLWQEGFATYVSGLINPNESDEVLLMQADLAKLCSQKDEVKNLSKLYLEVLNTDGQTSYDDWFLMSGTTQPVRRGYCLGLQVIRELAKTHSLSEMTTWNETRFGAEIQTVLSNWAASH